MKPNLGYYVQKISNVIQDTEAMGEDMHPCYEEIRTAIDNEHVEEISPERLSEIAIQQHLMLQKTNKTKLQMPSLLPFNVCQVCF